VIRGALDLGSVAAALAILVLGTACSRNPAYEAFEVTRHEEPKTTFRFSAGNATPAWPIGITVPGREIQSAEDGERISLQRYWVAEHVKQGATLAGMGSAKCSPRWPDNWRPPLPPQPRVPYCDVMIIDNADGRNKHAEFYFYIGNWPSFRDLAVPGK
jgi:hypothetical protein